MSAESPAARAAAARATPPPDAVASDTVVVVTGAGALDPQAVAAIPDGAVIVAADGGLDHARAAGLSPHVLVGDLDSVTATGLAWASANIEVHRHPVDKATTDTELAIANAVARQPPRLLLIAGAGDRLDHAIAALGALGAPSLDRLDVVEAWWGADRLCFATPSRPARLDCPAGTTFSVLAMHGACQGVDVVGARWPLGDADLGPLVGRGVSNQALDGPVEIRVRTGVLTAIVPGAQP